MREKWKRIWEKRKPVLEKISPCRYVLPMLPALFIGIFLLHTLSGGGQKAASVNAWASSGELDRLLKQLEETVAADQKNGTSKKLSARKKAGTAGAAGQGTAKKLSHVTEAGEYKDGVYEGSARGFGGQIKVSVTIKGGKITAIEVIEASGEGASYMKQAKGLIPSMLNGQTTNVDAVSGATFSSNGLIQAVRNALAKAVVKEEKKAGKKKKKKKKANKKEDSTVESGEYKDGTYEVQVTCEPDEAEQFSAYTISMSITIKDNKITDIRNLMADTGKTNKKYTQLAENGMISAIISQGSCNGVDVVTGATCSSKAIQEACKKAFAMAKKASASPEDSTDATEEKKEETTEKEPEATTEKKPEETTELPEVEGEEGKIYKNGNYTVSVLCRPDEDEDFSPYTISMVVTVQKDKITGLSNITADTDRTNQAYLKDAQKGMTAGITAVGTMDGVDAVSGATCSSEAIREGCRLALEQAKNRKEE